MQRPVGPKATSLLRVVQQPSMQARQTIRLVVSQQARGTWSSLKIGKQQCSATGKLGGSGKAPLVQGNASRWETQQE